MALPLSDTRGLAEIAARDKEDPRPFLEDAIKAGSKSAPVFVKAADGLPANQALPLLKRAEQLNPLWAEPIFLEAQLTSDLAPTRSSLTESRPSRSPRYPGLAGAREDPDRKRAR